MSPIPTLILACALIGCSKDPPPADAPAAPTDDPPAASAADARTAFEARAKAATGALKASLVGALQGAMKEGPAAAVTACNTQAPDITRAAAKAGVTVGRTAARLRNPANAPAPWLEPLLVEYAAIPAADAKPKVVTLDGGRLGYVEPLYTGGLCLTCHGEPTQIPDDVGARLAALYPEDAATGYAPGAFRGLVWATGR